MKRSAKMDSSRASSKNILSSKISSHPTLKFNSQHLLIFRFAMRKRHKLIADAL